MPTITARAQGMLDVTPDPYSVIMQKLNRTVN